MIVVLLVIFQVLGLVSAVHAIMSSRTPQGSIAWTVSLITFPYVSVPAYWVFGRNKFRGYTLARQHELEIIGDLIKQAKQRVEGIRAPISQPGGPVTGAEKMARGIVMSARKRETPQLTRQSHGYHYSGSPCDAAPIAQIAIAAVSVRRVVGPRVTRVIDAASAIANSSADQPPSGPTHTITGESAACASTRLRNVAAVLSI